MDLDYFIPPYEILVNSLHLIERHSRKSENRLVQRNKQKNRKALLSSFHLNGHTLGFHPRTQKLEPPSVVQHYKQHHKKVL